MVIAGAGGRLGGDVESTVIAVGAGAAGWLCEVELMVIAGGGGGLLGSGSELMVIGGLGFRGSCGWPRLGNVDRHCRSGRPGGKPNFASSWE